MLGSPSAGSRPLPADPGAEAFGATPHVEAVVRTLDRAIRAHHLYDGISPAYERLVAALKASFVALWHQIPTLTLNVQENVLLWDGCKVYEGQQRPGDLAFLFFRDGIRELTFLPGFEETDLADFLGLIVRIQRLREDEDDLITLFWHHPFAHFQYRNVEVAVDGLDAFTRDRSTPEPIDPALVHSDAAASRAHEASGVEGLVAPQPIEMRETLHLLDPVEIRRLRDDLDSELGRDLMRDILHGLLDRLQDGKSERQKRIVRILSRMLPGLLSAGRFREAAVVLPELRRLADEAGTLPREALDDVRELFDRLADPATVRELVRTLEETATATRVEDCAAMLRHFPPGALEPLLVAAQGSERPALQQILFEVAARLAGDDPARVAALLGASSPLLAAGAARIVGRLGVAAAAPEVARLLERHDPAVRLAAVGALQELRVPSAAVALQGVLDDSDRDVRIAAARALGALKCTPARLRLEGMIQSRRIRESDITERLAFFEAYGSVAGAEGVELLGRLLNAKNWLGRREPAEIRASAALALGRSELREARIALERAVDDPEAVVRTAVARALRRESS
jgi:hypothetical protein